MEAFGARAAHYKKIQLDSLLWIRPENMLGRSPHPGPFLELEGETGDPKNEPFFGPDH
jgi:hypothetical protein